MRGADILLLIGAAVPGVALILPYTCLKLMRWRFLLGAGLAGVVVSQVVLHRFFWQLVPVDLGYLCLATVCVLLRRTRPYKIRVVAVTSLALTLSSFAMLLVLPVFRLPRPPGPYAVGTRIVHLVDTSRADRTFASGHRELMVQVWYPADVDGQPVAMYRRWKETTLLSSYDAYLKTHSYLNAPVAQRGKPFPVLLFNHAWGGERTQNTYETEYLASYGYVVVSIDHTHNASIVAFPDGQVVRSTPMPSIDDFSHSSYDEQMQTADRELNTQAMDDIFALDKFSEMNSDPRSPWFGVLDLRRVGAFGHSFGGATAVEACFRDPRIRAALNMDGWMYGAIGHEVLEKPLFVMYEAGWPPDPRQLAKESASSAPSDRMDIWDLHNLDRTLAGYGGYVLTLDHTRHMNFSDRSLYSPIHSLTDSGSIDPALAHRAVNEYTRAFFDHVLKGEPEPLLEQSHQPYAFARLKEWGGAVGKRDPSPDSSGSGR